MIREFTPETILEDQLGAISSQVKADMVYTTFEYKGHQYYPDFDSIIGIVLMSMINPTLTIRWKTADKLEDGITNIYVELTASEVIEMGTTYFQHRSLIWETGDIKKKKVKEDYKNANKES